MLVLSRKEGETLIVGEARITITRVRGPKVTVMIEAPQEIRVWREKTLDKPNPKKQ